MRKIIKTLVKENVKGKPLTRIKQWLNIQLVKKIILIIIKFKVYYSKTLCYALKDEI